MRSFIIPVGLLATRMLASAYPELGLTFAKLASLERRDPETSD